MRTEKNLFPQVIDFANLYRAFHGASHGKRERLEVREFEYHLETRLWEIHHELEGGSYAWGPFHRFWVCDPKRREIRAAPFRDRVVHHALFNVLDPIFRRGFIADSYACIPGRGTHRAVQRYRGFVRARAGRGYRVQGDVKHYFASVDHAVLLDRLRRRIGDQRLWTLLEALVTHGAERPSRGMPIGGLTSQLFANVYLDALDHFVKEHRLDSRHSSGRNDGMNVTPIARLLQPAAESFFLFGPRGTGKSCWLADRFGDAAVTFDLLDEALLVELLAEPGAFARKLDGLPAGAWVVIDEVQRAPVLLNAVHRLIETRKLRFVLCGSSARQLRRKGVNLLAGRAVERRLHPFTATELGRRFDLDDALTFGTLPLVWSAPNRPERLGAYVRTYLAQEIQAEAAVRQLPSFVRFLPIAALFHGQVLNVSSLARDAGVARTSIQSYREILEQTLLTFTLDAYRPRLRVKEVAHPKFFWADAGLVRAFKKQLGPLQEEERGPLFEGWVAQTLRAMNDYVGLFDEWFYWSSHGSAGTVEVDFLLRQGRRLIAIEAKAGRRFRPDFLKGLAAIGELGGVKRRILVYGGKDSWTTDDRVEVMSVARFVAEVARGF